MNKEVKLGLLAAGIIVILLAALAGLDYYNEQKKLIKEKDVNLTQERQIYQDRLANADTQLANSELTPEQRYNWLMNKGFQLQGLGKLEEAFNSFEEAAEVKAEDYTSYVAMYSVQLEMNDNRGAKENIQKAIELKPTDADIWRKYIVLEKERFGASNEQLNSIYIDALRDTLSSVDILTSYAQFLESSGNLQAAKEYWQKAIEANASGKTLYEAEIKRLDALLAQQNQ